MTVKEIKQLLSGMPEDYELMLLTKSNVSMEIKRVQVVNDRVALIIPFGMTPSDTLLQDFENTDKP